MSASSLLDVIIKEIRAAAQEEAAAIIQKAEEEAKRILEEAQERAIRLREEKRQRLLEEARRAVEREFAPKRRELRQRAYMEQYKVLSEELRGLIMEVLEKLRHDPAGYRVYLERALGAAVKSLGSSIVVHPCEGERDLLEEVVRGFAKSNPSSAQISIGEEVNCDGGFLARTPDGRVYFNATFGARASEVFERLLPEVFQYVFSTKR